MAGYRPPPVFDCQGRQYRGIQGVVIEGDIAKIPLTRGMFAIIDAVDLPLVENFTWRASDFRSKWIYASTGTGSHMRMHRVIAGAKLGEKVDHWDGDGLNNRRLNLRKCSNADNIANSRKRAGRNTSDLKGVCLTKTGWRAQIMRQYKKYNLGTYPTQELAAAAYDEAARRLFGEFARCNFPHATRPARVGGDV